MVVTDAEEPEEHPGIVHLLRILESRVPHHFEYVCVGRAFHSILGMEEIHYVAM